MRFRIAVAGAVALAATLLVLLAQPIGSPWWIYADADASYTASGIDLMAGERSLYLDHPGMPLEALMAITVETRYLVHKVSHPHTTPHAYAGARLLHLDDSRLFFRGYAILFYAFGALAAFVLLWRLLGSPLWGAAGTVLWLAAPGLQAMSIQFRPDGLLAGLVLAVGYLIVRAAERRDAWLYTLAALLLGLTVTVKLHAAGLFLAFAIALIWRPPPGDWWAAWRRAVGAWLRRYRIPLSVFAVVWVAFCVILDRNRIPFTMTPHQRLMLIGLAGAYVLYLLAVALAARPGLSRLARGPLRPVGAVLVTAFAIGIVLPTTVVIDNLPLMLVKIAGGLTGGGVNQGVSLFTLHWGELVHGPLVEALVVFGVATVAAAVGVARRDLRPLIWWSGAAVTGVMALARLGTTHYFAPAYVLSIPPALWLAQRAPRRLAPVAALALAAFVFVPVLRNLSVPDDSAKHQEQQAAAIAALEQRLLPQPGEVALTDDYTTPAPDARYFGLVQQYVTWTPDYPYRLLLDTNIGLQTAERRHLRPTYYIGSLPLSVAHQKTLKLAFGTYVVRPLPATMNGNLGVGAMQLLPAP